MTRGRPRKRLTRMHAAVDAMLQFGFSEDVVVRHVKELLKAYGGDEGWPFIEDASYKELLDAILREQEIDDPENDAGNGDQINSCGEEKLVGTCSTQQEPPSDIADISKPIATDSVHSTSVISKETNGWKDINPNDHTIVDHANNTSNEHPPRITENPPPMSRKRLHCYGWIDDKVKNVDDFTTFKPSSKVLGPPPEPAPPRDLSGSALGERRRKRSRWDLRPEDL